MSKQARAERRVEERKQEQLALKHLWVWMRLEKFLSQRDGDCTVETGSSAMYSCKLRVTVQGEEGIPDRSYVTYAVAGNYAEDAIESALDEMESWLRGPVVVKEIRPGG